MFNPREQAFIIWLVVFLLYALSMRNVRSSVPQILRSLGPLMKHPIFIITNIYIFLVFIAVYHFEILENSVIKDYMVWILLSLYPLIFKISTKYMDLSLQEVVKEVFKLSIIPIFIINEYTFPLWIEIILAPLLFIIGGMLTLAKIDEKYDQAKKISTLVITFIGLSIIIVAVTGLTKNYEDTYKIDFWQKMFFDVIGILLHFPLLFVLRYMCFYEQILVRTGVTKRFQKLLALILIFKRYRFNSKALKKILKNHTLGNVKSEGDLKVWLEVNVTEY